MKRSQLAHILRSACRITGDPNILVIGSQSILGKFSHVGASKAMCLDPHDLVLSKLVANREKDIEFAEAVIAARLVELGRLIELVAALPAPEGVRRRVRTTLRRVAR